MHLLSCILYPVKSEGSFTSNMHKGTMFLMNVIWTMKEIKYAGPTDGLY